MTFRKNVHIVPLGYEVDRAICTFDSVKADIVYLLSVPEDYKSDGGMGDEQKRFVNIVRKKLEEKGIQVKYAGVDMFSFLDVLKTVSSIIRKEKSDGNPVYLNVSSCGKLMALAAGLAGLVQEAELYYVPATGYRGSDNDFEEHGSSVCETGMEYFIPNFKVVMPDEISQHILVELYRKRQGLYTDDIINIIHERDISGFEEKSPLKNKLMKLNRRYLDKLEQNEYISREKIGKHNRILITEKGEYVACASGLIDIGIN